MKNYSDDELLYLIRMGNTDAEEHFYKRYYKEIKEWVKRYTVMSHLTYDYEDVVQESMLNFSNILDSYRYDKDTSIKTFMKNVIERRAINYMRYGKDKKIVREFKMISLNEPVNKGGIDGKCKYEDIIPDEDFNRQPKERLVIKEECSQYCEKINEVASEMEKDVLMLLAKGFSIKEIAEMKKIPIKSIYNAIYRYSKKMNH